MITDKIIFVLNETTLGFYTTLKITTKVLKSKSANKIVQRRQKSMCLAAASGVAVAAAKLLLARWESWYMY